MGKLNRPFRAVQPSTSYFPVPLQVGQVTFLLPLQLWQVCPLTLPCPLQTGQVIVLEP